MTTATTWDTTGLHKMTRGSDLRYAEPEQVSDLEADGWTVLEVLEAPAAPEADYNGSDAEGYRPATVPSGARDVDGQGLVLIEGPGFRRYVEPGEADHARAQLQAQARAAEAVLNAPEAAAQALAEAEAGLAALDAKATEVASYDAEQEQALAAAYEEARDGYLATMAEFVAAGKALQDAKSALARAHRTGAVRPSKIAVLASNGFGNEQMRYTALLHEARGILAGDL